MESSNDLESLANGLLNLLFFLKKDDFSKVGRLEEWV